MTLGTRTLLAMTCWGCGKLKQAREFGRHVRRPGEPPYIDRRCSPCRWGLKVRV